MTSFVTSTGKKIRIEAVAIIHFHPNGTDVTLDYRKGTSEIVVADHAALKALTNDGFFNYNGTNGAGPDSTYVQSRINLLASISAEPTGASATTVVIEGVTDLVLDNGDPESRGHWAGAVS